ncbi:hypothetical protein GJ496_007412, partial [Pomphorhynchus laevis]
DPKQWADISYCLFVIVQSERTMKKLNELFPLYGEKLHDDNVYRYFRNLINARKRSVGSKQVNKLVVEEFSDLVEKVRSHGLEDAEGNLINANMIFMQKRTQKTQRGNKTTRLPANRKKARRSKSFSSSSIASESNRYDNSTKDSSVSSMRKRPPGGRAAYVDLSTSDSSSS